MQALAAMHLLWAWALVPPVALAVRHLGPRGLTRCGLLLATLGALALAAVAVHEVLTWEPEARDYYSQFLGRRILYSVAVAKDVPAVQLVLAGLACWVAASVKRPAGAPSGPAGDGASASDGAVAQAGHPGTAVQAP
jgi:hypothetical protein